MKRNSTRSLKWMAVTSVIISILALALIFTQTIGCVTDWTSHPKAVWIEGFKGLQLTILIMRFVGALASFALLVAFLLNTIKAHTNGVLFPRKNVGILFGLAASTFVALFCRGNLHLLSGTKEIHLGFEELLVPIIICIVAVIYKTAVQVKEENSLTI